jgi:hypothetical protein
MGWQMNNYNNGIYDKKMKQGLEELAAEVSVPDVTQAFKRYKRQKQKSRIRSVAVAAAILLLILPAIVGPAQAFTGFIRIAITRMITETSQLFQRSDEGAIGDIETLQIKQFDSLSELKQEQAAGMFLPSGLDEEGFIFAEIVYNNDKVRRFEVELLHLEELLRFMVINAVTSARAIDIEDFIVQSLIVNNIEVTSFSDDQGFTLLEWDVGQHRFELSGYMSAEELLKSGLVLGLFN